MPGLHLRRTARASRRRGPLALLAGLAAAVGLAACSSDPSAATSGSGPSTTASTSPPATTAARATTTAPATTSPPATTTPPTTAPATTTAASRAAPHVMVLMMENESFNAVVGSRDAPYTNSLAKQYLEATSSYARGHDSLPNYLEIVSGHAFEQSGTSGDCTPSSCGGIGGPTIASQLQSAGIAWRAFMGAMPADCAVGNSTSPGGYGVRHNPFVYFPAGRRGPACQDDVPASGLLAALDASAPPDFVFYSPTICQDGGNDAPCSTIASGDRFLSTRLPAIMATPWYQDGGAIVVTWDEGAGSDHAGRFETTIVST